MQAEEYAARFRANANLYLPAIKLLEETFAQDFPEDFKKYRRNNPEPVFLRR